MRFSPFLLLPLVACGGSTSPEDPANSGSPADVNDPNVLPTGAYDLSISAASCNMNDLFEAGGRALVLRSKLGRPPILNIPAPLRLGPGLGATPRQEIDLTLKKKSWTTHDQMLCPDGLVTRELQVREVSATSISLTWREDRIGCETPEPSCAVDFELTLAERACPPPDAPGCTPKSVILPIGSSAAQRVDCECLP